MWPRLKEEICFYVTFLPSSSCIRMVGFPVEPLFGEKSPAIAVTLALEFIPTLTLQGNFPCTLPPRNSALLKLSKTLFITMSDKWWHGTKMCSRGFSSCWLFCNLEPPRHMAKSYYVPEPKTCIRLILPEGTKNRGSCVHKSVVDTYLFSQLFLFLISS